jgi:SAM-dependent methyltransferase
MEYDEASSKLSDAYVDRYSLEFPTIFSILNFEEKSVLEVGPAEGYFMRDVSLIARRVESTNSFDKLPFANKSFDIVLSRWIVQGVDDIESFVKEMCRVARENVMIILPSDDGDETRILSIKYPGKFKSRKDRIEKIKSWISDSGFKAKEDRRLINFVFREVNEAAEVFFALGFRNDATDDEISRLKKFLLERKREDGVHVTQGASFICGYK